MLLASVTAIRDQLGFDDMSNITDAITGALHTAEALLSARLGTPFDAGAFSDTFYVDEPGFIQGDMYKTEFKLTRGFVQDVTEVSLTTPTSMYFIVRDQPSLITSLATNKEKGLCLDVATFYRRSWVKISYTAGFTVDDTDPASYDLTKVPSWLQQLASLRAMLLLNGTGPLENAGIKLDAKTLGSEIEAIIQQHMRYFPTALLPV
jgi:hypothetical protein